MNTVHNSKQTTCLCRDTGGKGTLPAQRTGFNTLDNWGHKTPTQSKRKRTGKKRLKGRGPEHVYNTLGYTTNLCSWTLLLLSWCLMSSDVIWHIRDKLWPMPKHGSIRKVYACLAVTCHLHFWQNDRDFLRATVVTRGWNVYRNKSQHRKSTLENKILPPFQQGFEPATFQSRVRRSNHWAIPAPGTLLLLIAFI